MHESLKHAPLLRFAGALGRLRLKADYQESLQVRTAQPGWPELHFPLIIPIHCQLLHEAIGPEDEIFADFWRKEALNIDVRHTGISPHPQPVGCGNPLS